MEPASEKMKKYFEEIEQGVQTSYALALQARKKGLDPEKIVDIRLAKNMAERVEGLISTVAPQLVGSGVTERIIALEQEYSPLDWRVALKIALEVAKEKFCSFKHKQEAMEVGIRTGFAYQTAGIVAAPLEGFTQLKMRHTQDGKEYFVPCYAGPIRGAGGTAAAFSLLLTDYMRVHMGYAKYDPSEKEVQRYKTEIYDYHERVTNLQYLPSLEELDFLLRHLPVQVDGDPTETKDVSNYKDTPRVETNKIRGGICLVLAEGLSQKAPKLWKRLEEWGPEFGLDWSFLKEFIILQKEIKSKKKTVTTEKKEKISPNYTFIADMVAGRPVLTYPLAAGGFRLRYGRARTSGFSAAAINPATMYILDRYVAIGTQLKVERPGKAAAITTCDMIHGPVVLLDNGKVCAIETVEDAKQYKGKVKEIVYMGDILFNYGDFSENGHILVPCGYNEDWYVQELLRAMNKEAEQLSAEKKEHLRNPKKEKLFQECLFLSQKYEIPMHPRYTYYWSQITDEQFKELLLYLEKVRLHDKKVVFPFKQQIKRILEILAVPHLFVNNEFIVIENDDAEAFLWSLGIKQYEEYQETLKKFDEAKTNLENIELFCGMKIKDKAGTTIGCRMGRPEKAKMRELTGSPHTLFPVSAEGGRLRSFNAAIEKRKVTADFPAFFCSTCQKERMFGCCEVCGLETEQWFFCAVCGKIKTAVCPTHGKAKTYKKQEVPIDAVFSVTTKYMDIDQIPQLIKGIRGTSNEDHVVEYIGKGIIRAKHNVYVNKDGTIRYDMSELPLTHFKPAEINCSVEKLRSLGYENDIYGNSLDSEEQILELLPQDIVLPGAMDTLDEPADAVLLRAARCMDEMLERIYKLPAFYKLEKKNDLIGHLTICLAPHISAGMVGRIIGFSKTQGFFAHPLFHAALRRDCFAYETLLPIYDGKEWKNWKIGELVEKLRPEKIVDRFGTKEINVSGYKTIGLDKKGNVTIVSVNNFTQHTAMPMIKIKTKSGREITTTMNHKFLVKKKEIVVKRGETITKRDKLVLPRNIPLPQKIKNDYINNIISSKPISKVLEQDSLYVYDEIIEIKSCKPQKSYCLNVENNVVCANGILTKQCDGDEASVTLLLDGLLNFSRRYLPARVGARTMDAPLVLTSKLVPTEVDDQALGLDVVMEYPLELYEAAAQYKNPWEVKVEQIKNRVNTPLQYEQIGFTHTTESINAGVSCSAYKELPSMEEKLNGQMVLAEKIRAVNEADVARLVIEKHFLKDTKGNLRKFSQQNFRCVKCNESYRRPPLQGKCLECGGKIIFTVSEGSVIKYLELSISLTKKYAVSPYLIQTLDLLQRRVDAEFGREKEKQAGLGSWT